MARRCPGCETLFNVEKSSSRQIFCSKTCRDLNRQNTPVERTCPICQHKFTTDISPRRVYCSKKCRAIGRVSDAEQTKRECPVCDGTFEAPSSTRQIYCSPHCRRTAEKQRDEARDLDRARRLGGTPKPAAELAVPALAELSPPQPRQTIRPVGRTVQERDPMEPTATRECPHCRQPVTIVALLATPEAARPSMPTGPADPIPIRRTQ